MVQIHRLLALLSAAPLAAGSRRGTDAQTSGTGNRLNAMHGLELSLPQLFTKQIAAVSVDPVDGVRALVAETCAFWNVTGCSVGVTFNGSEIMANFGVLDKGSGAAVGPDSLFQIGSTSKAYTAMALLQRAADGELDLDVPVKDYLPEFALNASGSEGLTLRDMMSHRTGMPRHDLLWAKLLPPNRTEAARRNFVKRFPGLALDKPIRYRWEYNNMMVVAAGLVAGLGHKHGWEGLAKEKVLEPLNMTDTWLHTEDLDSNAWSRFATPYSQDGTLLELLATELIGPAGSIVSSAREQLKWLTAHMDQLRGKTPLVDSTTVAQLVEPNAPAGLLNHAFGTYTLGWWFEQLTTDIVLLHHGGNTNGFSAHNVVVLQAANQLFGETGPRLLPLAGISILTNQGGSTAPTMLVLQLVSLLAKLPLVSDLNERQWQAMAPGRAQAAEALRELEQLLEEGKKQPSKFPVSQLEGLYEHSAYGQLVVGSLSDGSLTMAANGQDTEPLGHLWNDTFGLNMSAGAWLPFTFVAGDSGSVARLVSPLEPTVPAIVFERAARASIV